MTQAGSVSQRVLELWWLIYQSLTAEERAEFNAEREREQAKKSLARVDPIC